ncbi:MAG: hypothetical protein ACTSPY_11130 [Candidatus Helarchaeota archaeon]
MDLDNFKEISSRKGWIKYRPNIITGTLTKLIIELVNKHMAVVLHGLNEKEGTEECMLLFTAPELETLLDDLEYIRKEIKRLGIESKTYTTISIGIACGKNTDNKPALSRKKKALYSSPLRNLAKKALNLAKKKGGDKILLK